MNCQTRTSADEIEQLEAGAAIYKNLEKTNEKLTWCGGCGNYGIQKALMRALTLEGVAGENALLCYDVGCNGNGSDKIGAYTIHGLHGRVISLAAGAALANTDLPVIAMGGDGATFSEGINHLIHAVRSDYPMTFILHNNSVYGLTTGQASATTRTGLSMNSAPDGVALEPINAAELILALGPSFVARSFSGDPVHMTEMIRAGMRHPGFSFVEIMQVCPTYNKTTTQEWYWERIQFLDATHDRTDLEAARQAARDLDQKIALGVLYERETLPYHKRLASRENRQTTLRDEVAPVDISTLLATFV